MLVPSSNGKENFSFLFPLASSKALSISSVIPVPFRADTGIAFISVKFSNSLISNLYFNLSNSSYRFRAIIVGFSSSFIRKVKYKFLSKFVESTTLITTSGFSSSIKSLVIFSSNEYGLKLYTPGKSTNSISSPL